MKTNKRSSILIFHGYPWLLIKKAVLREMYQFKDCFNVWLSKCLIQLSTFYSVTDDCMTFLLLMSVVKTLKRTRRASLTLWISPGYMLKKQEFRCPNTLFYRRPGLTE